MTKQTELKELKPVFSGQQSFHGKAVVTWEYPKTANSIIRTLYSYGIPVAKIYSDGVHPQTLTFGTDAGYSATTRKHVVEFLKQAGLWEVVEALRDIGFAEYGIKPLKSLKKVFDTIKTIEVGDADFIYGITRK